MKYHIILTMKKSHGFTFVEIAIVLVIMGLLLGMVLKGQEIITNAKIKNLESNFQSIAQAVSIYQERYHALPGDDSNAERFDTLTTSTNGDGNGKIGDPFNSETENDESRLVWLHLRYAGLVARTLPEDRQNKPNNVFNGIIGISSDSNYSEIGRSNDPNLGNYAKGENIPLFIGFTKIPGKIAVIIESSRDDLEVDEGKIRSDKENYDGDNKINKVEHQLYFSL